MGCEVSLIYMDRYMRRRYKGHKSLEGLTYAYYCEGQDLWGS